MKIAIIIMQGLVAISCLAGMAFSNKLGIDPGIFQITLGAIIGSITWHAKQPGKK